MREFALKNKLNIEQQSVESWAGRSVPGLNNMEQHFVVTGRREFIMIEKVCKLLGTEWQRGGGCIGRRSLLWLAISPGPEFPHHLITAVQSSVACVVRVTLTSLALDPSLALSLLNIVANEHWTVKTIFIDVFAQPL